MIIFNFGMDTGRKIDAQLLIVVEGEGIVKGKENVEHRIVAGFGAFWEAGEWHETRTEQGLTAMVIESPSLKPGVIQ